MLARCNAVMTNKIMFCSLILISLTSFAWGPIGHRTVGQIADSRLSPAAASAVAGLLAGQSLADVANWADSLKSGATYPQAIWYHFEKISDNVSYLDNLKTLPDWQQKKGGVVTAILMANKILRDPTAAPELKTDALKFLVHFVGDIHQPFHSGRPEDNGGVKIPVTWMGTPMSLHAIWDSGMIATGHADILNNTMPLVDAANNFSKYLNEKFATLLVKTDFDTEGWLNETMALRVSGYDPLYNTDPTNYQNLHLPEIDLRIYTAGLRLAELLNQIYTNQPTPTLEQDLYKKIEDAVGSLDLIISFHP